MEYKAIRLDRNYRVDLLVEDTLVISGAVANNTGYHTPKLKGVVLLRAFHALRGEMSTS